ncbi:hypothetical protein L950_0227215 [Sphingobacterium sp. IITKGP-BTPF85]|nr:hypothetical protein L950_0227215 [Sphingobacterium sp. IITKGP-BTPF85]
MHTGIAHFTKANIRHETAQNQEVKHLCPLADQSKLGIRTIRKVNCPVAVLCVFLMSSMVK